MCAEEKWGGGGQIRKSSILRWGVGRKIVNPPPPKADLPMEKLQVLYY